MSYDPADYWNEYMSGEPDRFTTHFCWCNRPAVEGGLCPVHFDRQAEEESLDASCPPLENTYGMESFAQSGGCS